MSIDTSFALYEMKQDENATMNQIISKVVNHGEYHEDQCPICNIVVMPTHHIDTNGNFNGFKFTTNENCYTSKIPFSQSMFFGVAACECFPTKEDVARLIEKPEDCYNKLTDVIKEIKSELSCFEPASFSCIPNEIHGTHKDSSSSTQSHIVSHGRRAVDQKNWKVEPPITLGVYQAHIRNKSGERRHAIFVACEGGCQTAANEYYTMMFDLQEKATLKEALDCEETWWLQKASSRSRNHILYLATEALGLKPKASVLDAHSMDQRRVVTPACETLTHDIVKGSNGNVQVLNHCVDTTRVQNGILCKMHPNEGLWIFRGSQRSNSHNVFGGMFGDTRTCGSMPTHTFQTDDPQHQTIANTNASGKRERYLHFNNSFMKNLEAMGWDRDYQIVELIPIAVVHSDTGKIVYK